MEASILWILNLISMNHYDINLDKNKANFVPLTPLSFLQRAKDIYPNYEAIIYEDEREALEEIAEYLNLMPDAVNRLLKWTVEGYGWMQAGYDLLNDLSR